MQHFNQKHVNSKSKLSAMTDNIRRLLQSLLVISSYCK
jgi:hypothetical protein